MFDFSKYSTKPKYDKSNKLVIGKMKDETIGVAIDKFVGLKPKMQLFLLDKKKHKKTKGVSKSFVAAISHNEYEDVLLNNECIKHSMNQSIEQEQMKSTKSHFLFLNTKFILKTMNMIDQLLIIRVNYQKGYLNGCMFLSCRVRVLG